MAAKKTRTNIRLREAALAGDFLGELLAEKLSDEEDEQADALATKIAGSGEFSSNKMLMSQAEKDAAIKAALAHLELAVVPILSKAMGKYAEPDDSDTDWGRAKRAARGG
jgi:hypothetical protein